LVAIETTNVCILLLFNKKYDTPGIEIIRRIEIINILNIFLILLAFVICYKKTKNITLFVINFDK